MNMKQKSVLLLAGILAILSSQGMYAQDINTATAQTTEVALQLGELESTAQDEQDPTRSGQQLNNIWRRVNKIPNISQADQVFTQQEITAGPGVMIVKPGVYHLAENITFSNAVAITIASDDVVLDLTGRSIDGQNRGGIAIQIEPGYKNISIVNGSIKRCICAGIFADGSAQPKEQSPYESITIKNILIADLGLCDIESTNPNEVLSILDDLSNNSSFDEVLEAGLGGQIDLLSRAVGIFINCARKVIIEECQVCNVQGDGFFLRNVADAVIKESQAESNGADGFVFDTCDISTITSCKAERNGLHGFEELACNGDNSYRLCTARQNGMHGFRVVGGGKIVEGCISNQNTLDGFNFVTPKNSTVDGSPDITFGTNGIVTTNIGTASIANGMALQKDGKIVLVGASDTGSGLDFATARYNPDGSLDLSFGVGGQVTTNFGGNDQAHAVAIQEDGKIVVAGYSDESGALGFALARYTVDGALDPDFNQGSGLITHNLSPFDDGVLSIALQEDGKIVVGGAVDMGGNFDFAVLRFTPHGQLDTTFNGTGIVITDFGGMFDVCFDITLQQDGKIVAAGFTDVGGVSKFALARYNTDGSLDTSFGGTGMVTTPIGSAAQGQAVTIQKDGKIIVAGVADVGTPYFALARYNVDGSLDSSFGGTGTVTDSFAGAFSVALAVAVQTDGKINAIGYTDLSGQIFVGLIRYTTQGELDAGFNGGVGAAIIGTGSGFTQAQAGLLDAQGRLLVAGADGSPTDFFAARVNIFKRCSMIKDSTAQANGRDGFNLEDAYNVAVLGNQASCNTRNGFIAGSTTANNLYNNLSYDNTANYISATDLTVKPDEISSYWANVDPDKSVFDCNICSLVDAIDSKIDLLLNGTSFMDSSMDNFIPCIFHTCSVVDVIEEKVDVATSIAQEIESKVDVIDEELSVVDSKVDALQDTADIIESKVCIIESLVEVIDATTKEIDSEIDALTSCIEHTCSVVDVIEDKVDVATSIAQEIESKTDVIDEEVSVVDSKIDILLARDCCDCEQFIYQADIPYVITEPGIYCLAESVQNTGLNDFLITVSSSDVVLELGEHLMDGGTQDGLSQGAANGIVIVPGVTGVTIKNGILTNFASHGIYAPGSGDDAVQSPIRCLNFSRIKVANLSQFLPSIVDQPDQLGSLLDELSDDTGFDKILEAGLADQLDISRKPVGIYIDCANQVIIDNCEVVKAYGDGFFLRYVQEAVVKDCQSNSNGGNGFVFDNCDVSCVSGCKAEQNGFNGFYEVACAGDNSYKDCTAKQNGIHGFRVIGGGKTIENCIANQNTLDGFYVVTPENSTVDGSLDITFGGDGIVTTDFSTSDDRGFAIALQKDGKIVVAGSSAIEGSSDFALARYNPDGSLDTTFNGAGWVTTDFGGTDDVAFGVAIQEDGKIVAAGRSNASDSGSYDFALARYNNDGSLDASFGGTGMIIANLGGFEWANALTIQRDGKILAVGFSSGSLALIRYNNDGSLDTSFNGSGVVITNAPTGGAEGRAVAIQDDGKLVVVGKVSMAGNANFLLVRYNMNGSLDTTFGSAGFVETDLGGLDEKANAVAIQKDGKIVVAGSTNVGPNDDYVVLRYNDDGSLDMSFNGTGMVTTDFSGNDQANAISIQKDGKIIVSGQVLSGNIGVARYFTGGSLDSSFNNTGLVITDVFNGAAQLLQPDGKLVVAGFASGSGGFDFAVVRYNIFKRCSSIRESIAQANGRDGFNLECAFNVALLNSEASCNERNGFLGSSSTANNLYNNISYNNSTNYYSVTDLTVEPNSISSYWGNVEPDKSTPDIFADKIMSTSSIVEDIDSKVDILIARDCCDCEHFIYQADIPYVITEPGIYCLAESVQNTGLNDFLITVSSSDVVLELGEHLMDGGTQDGLSQGAANGIVIVPGVTGVTIKNGTLTNFASHGIYAPGSGDDAVQSPIRCLNFSCIKVANLSQFLPSIVDQPDQLGSILDTLSNNTGFDKILEAGLADQLDISRKPVGIYIDCANQVIIDNCEVVNAYGDGFFLRYVQEAVVKDSQANSNGGNGFVFDNCDVSCITACKAEQNGFNGFYEVACAGDNSYKDCTAKQNGIHGFRVIGGGKTIENCIANQNTLDGFYVVTPENSTVDGSLDITFNGDGKVITDFGVNSYDPAFGMALQEDGKIVVAGYSDVEGSNNFAVARYNTDGSLDTSFNGTGKVTTDFGGGSNDQAFAVAIQQDGKIVVVGLTGSGEGSLIAVARYNSDGSLDISFNPMGPIPGTVTTSINSIDDVAYAVAIQQDSKIVVAGYSNELGTAGFCLVRYNTDGSLDTSFNSLGMMPGTVTTHFTNSFEDKIRGIAIQDDGKIVVVGYTTPFGIRNFALARYNLDGTLDTTFNGSGTVVTSIGGYDYAQAVVIQKDDRIVVAGTAEGLGGAVVRYNTDGTLDTTFNGSGMVTTSSIDSNAELYAVGLQKDGKIVAAGRSAFSGTFFLVRLQTDGTFDASFGGAGAVSTSFAGNDISYALAIEQDGKLVAAGMSESGSVDFALARYNIFKRCSTIRESIAQANGRDGFNLECAFNVALINSEASCNERNGFLGSSSTANNLYSNISYNNSTNYYSVTDLTVEPNSISSYWGNVEPDKSTPDIFADKIMSTSSIVEDIDSKVCIIESLVEVIDTKTQEIDSEIDALMPCIEHTCSIVDVIEEKVDEVSSQVEEVDSKTDVIDGEVSVIDSKVDVIDQELSVVDSKIDAITPCINSTCSVVEDIDSKVDILIARDCCDCEHFIYQADIPYVITEPGIYCLAESVQNTGLNDFLITVSSSDVVLELGEHLMDGGTQDGLSQGAANGIVIVPGVTGVTIKNGTLTNFASHGIYAPGSGDDAVQSPIRCLNFSRIKVANLSQFLPSIVDQPDQLGSILDTLSNNTGFDKILEAGLADQLDISRKPVGIYIDCANQVIIDNCEVVNAYGDGFFLRYVQEAVVKDSQANSNGGNGFVFDNCDVSCVGGCKAEQNGFNGFYEVACAGDNSYKDCTAKQNGIHGFRVIGGGKTIENCIANQNTLDGFYVVTPENSTVDGSLDITFGGDGIVTTDFSTSDDRGFATALQKDGKIVVTGFSSAAGSSDFALARYNPDGSLDTTFNGTGLVTTDFGGGDEVANGVVIQEDGKIVAAGYTNAGGNYNFAVARYNVDGSLDTTFNGTGQVTTNFGGFDQAYTLALQQDGKIVVAGFSNSVVAVARYNVDGSLDTSFNGTGMVTTTGIINDSQARAIAIQEDGKIVLAGFAVVAGNANMLVVRYQLNGTLDASFNGTGSVISTFGGTQDVANGVALQKDGKIVLSGTTNVNGDADFAVVRYNSDGSLDTSFNNGTGIVITDFGGDGDRATAVVIQKDGKIIAVGQALNSQLGIARYTTDGYLDTSFNGTGTVVNTSISTGRAALLQYDGKLVVAGFASGAGGFDFAVLRCNIFMRCSSIRESIAQANGRDGFNLEYAFNVALLNSEASCNARNGFLGSSSTANNLYSNLAYNNTANYLSATDLTVQPNSISSYWGNVEPDKTTPDIFADRLSVMESLLYEIKACACTPVVP